MLVNKKVLKKGSVNGDYLLLSDVSVADIVFQRSQSLVKTG